MGATEISMTQGGENFPTFGDEPSELNTEEFAQFVRLIRAGALT